MGAAVLVAGPAAAQQRMGPLKTLSVLACAAAPMVPDNAAQNPGLGVRWGWGGGGAGMKITGPGWRTI